MRGKQARAAGKEDSADAAGEAATEGEAAEGEAAAEGLHALQPRPFGWAYESAAALAVPVSLFVSPAEPAGAFLPVWLPIEVQ